MHFKNPATDFVPARKFFIGLDSDGCVFDSMEVKHKECFTPVTVWKWNLQSVSRFARECHEFVNLYSKWRGINRFPALFRTLELLAARPEVVARGFKIPDITSLKEWASTEKQLGNATLETAVAKTHDPILTQTLEWSKKVNEHIAAMVYGVPPFPFVRETLTRAQDECDMLVVSQTPCEALQREWEEHNLHGHVAMICGQEHGSKEEHLLATCRRTHPPLHSLMVGDAPGDLKAARAVGTLFYPIIPGREAESWERFYNEGYAKFIDGSFAGAYQAALIAEMDRALPAVPPWERK